MLATVMHILTSLETFSYRVTMLPDMGILARRDQNLHIGRMRIEGIVNFAFVIGTVGCTGKKGWFDLCNMSCTTV
jgi:hypothetical protein